MMSVSNAVDMMHEDTRKKLSHFPGEHKVDAIGVELTLLSFLAITKFRTEQSCPRSIALEQSSTCWSPIKDLQQM